MSSTQSPELDIFIERGVKMLKASIELFPPAAVQPPVNGLNLVTAVVAQEPPIDQSVANALLPLIYVAYSKNPIRRMDYTGRDTRSEAGARTYYLEFYNVIIVRDITKEASQKTCQIISRIVRDVYQKNLIMADPALPTNFIATTNEVVTIPFVLRSDNPAIQAINVICRPQQQVSLRT